MIGWLTPEERSDAITVLSRLKAPELHSFIDQDVKGLVTAVTKELRMSSPVSTTASSRDLAELMIDILGTDLLVGSTTGRGIRKLLVSQLDDHDLIQLHAVCPIANSRARNRGDRIEEVAKTKWHAGKTWAQKFTEAVGLPTAFAGAGETEDRPLLEDVSPFVPLNPLHNFYQTELVTRLGRGLRAPQMEHGAWNERWLLSLPTGAGKTRVAVEALLDWWAEGAIDRGTMLWIAQSDELCEQAVQSFCEVWRDRGVRGERRNLPVYRYWGKNDCEQAFSGVVVATIDKLNELVNRVHNSEPDITGLGKSVRAVVVDETHRIVAPQYRSVLGHVGIDVGTPNKSGAPGTPLLGLTATPYRGGNLDEIRRLVRMFNAQLVVPSGFNNPISELRASGVLSEVTHEQLPTSESFTLNPAELRSYQQFNRFPDSFLRRLGDNPRRNVALLDRLRRLGSSPTLVFACSVAHAKMLTVMLRRDGIKAAEVSADTRPATRRQIIEEFRAGNLTMLCNYGVLTTGFDAPKIENVMIARPTTSAVLYEQMIGRGTRGPLNGGTPHCVIIDVRDNIENFGEQMAYTRYLEYWN